MLVVDNNAAFYKRQPEKSCRTRLDIEVTDGWRL